MPNSLWPLCDPMDCRRLLPASLSMRFSRQEYCIGLSCPLPGDLPNPGIKLMSLTSPTSAGGFFTTSTMWYAHASFNKSPKKGGEKDETGTSLGVQWIGICLAVQGTQIQSLAQEDATEQHMPQNNEAHGPQLLKPVHSIGPASHSYWACELQAGPRGLRACAAQEKPLWWETHEPQLVSRSHLLQLENACTQ